MLLNKIGLVRQLSTLLHGLSTPSSNIWQGPNVTQLLTQKANVLISRVAPGTIASMEPHMLTMCGRHGIDSSRSALQKEAVVLQTNVSSECPGYLDLQCRDSFLPFSSLCISYFR